MRKFTFSLKFEANPVIEAENLEEAEAKAWEMMKGVKVVRDIQQPVREGRGQTIGVRHVQEDAVGYVQLEPCCLEEVEG